MGLVLAPTNTHSAGSVRSSKEPGETTNLLIMPASIAKEKKKGQGEEKGSGVELAGLKRVPDSFSDIKLAPCLLAETRFSTILFTL
jgi:hypothetical protein